MKRPKIVRPPYYLFAYSPTSGEVAVGHTLEAQPAEVPTHDDLASQLNEPGLIHGYAYRIDNGWRVTDVDHRPIADPHAKVRVPEELSRIEGKGEVK